MSATGFVRESRYEFDAPQHYDFQADDTEANKAGPSGRTPLRNANSGAATAAAPTEKGDKLKAIKAPLKLKGRSHQVVKTRLSKALQPRRVMPTRSTKQLTVPEDVELRTARRAQPHGKAGAAHADEDQGPAPSPYKPLLVRVKEFDKTPGRYKRKPEQLAPFKPLSITDPKDPLLLTTTRARPSGLKPREQMEADELAHMPMFKASTLNPLILSSSGQIGVPKVDKRDGTEAKPFHFVTDDRAEVRGARQQPQHGEAGPSGQRQQPQRTGEKDKGEKDLPKKARKSVAAHLLKIEEEPRHDFHARPVPRFINGPSMELQQPHAEAAAPTHPAPFKLATEQRGAQYRSTMAARVAAEDDAARRARVPRAHGLPLSTDMPLIPPKPDPRPLTVPEPFGLASEARHGEFQEQKKRAVEAEKAAKRADAEFKARPMWRGVPFRVHESTTGLTVPEDVQLHTSARAAERDVFNKAVAAQLAAQEARMREDEERRRVRKAAVFHARPVPDLSAAPAAKAPVPHKPLTKPVSPRLGRSKRHAADK
ncbi:Targeting protein for Xklp2 [Tetrabaena socialis]|uniref:Targeting protein for Xklp2 n=1 Tax=Tetrabaena socialis TaxID=47790 RepID=A0A2J8A7H0_9CHLO|nr:Targeting protein for Xklp2 [Tetrabaena socialis]|eukprot:PNH08486.1 Targeting protein for Xklp2 [Tetrabaena socialis]